MRGRLLRRYLKGLEENVVLGAHLGFRVGGVADYFFRAKSVDELILAFASAIFAELPTVVLGEGSHTLVSDTGVPGLVIKNEVREVTSLTEEGLMLAGSGMSIRRLTTVAAERGLSGLEEFGALNGTLGGLIARGAFGLSSVGLIRDLTVVRVRKPRFQRSDPLEMVEIVSLPAAKYSLRGRGDESGPVILTVKLKLRQKRRETILKALGQALTDAPSEASFRLLNSAEIAGRLGRETISPPELLKFAHLEGYAHDGVVLRGGRLFVSGRSTAEAVRRVAEMAKLEVRRQFGAILEETFTYVGRW